MNKLLLTLLLLFISIPAWANSGWYSTLQGSASDVEQSTPPNGVGLYYNSTDHMWEFSYGFAPSGGTTGQVLTKNSNYNYDYSWANGGGGVTSLTGDSLLIGNSASTGAVTLTTKAQTANTVIGSPSTTLSALTMPSCSGASSALIWTSGTGFGCNTITEGSGTVTSVSVNTGNGFSGIVGNSTTTPSITIQTYGINGILKTTSAGQSLQGAIAGTDFLAPTGSGAGLSGIPLTVSNSDGTLTISPTTGAVIASIALGHANTWTATQTLSAANLATDTSTGMKIGTSTSQKIGFFNATPIVQPSGNICTSMTNLGLVSSCTESGGGGSQTPWTSNIAGAGYSLTNVGSVSTNTIKGVSDGFQWLGYGDSTGEGEVELGDYGSNYTGFWEDINQSAHSIIFYGSGATVLTLGGSATFAANFNIVMNGSTSGSTTLEPSATASGTLTLPAGTDTLAGLTLAQTFTNKRITKRSSSTSAPGATPSMNTNSYDIFIFTGLSTAITSMTTNLTGTPVTGDLLEVWLTDNGTARAITWGASFNSTTTLLPATTVVSTRLRVKFEYNGSSWDCVAVT